MNLGKGALSQDYCENCEIKKSEPAHTEENCFVHYGVILYLFWLGSVIVIIDVIPGAMDE